LVFLDLEQRGLLLYIERNEIYLSTQQVCICLPVMRYLRKEHKYVGVKNVALNAKNMQKYGTNVPGRRILYFHEEVYHAAADLPWKDSWIPMDT
jgi:hypothetical protein